LIWGLPINPCTFGIMIETDRFSKVEVTSAAQLRAWLAAHHDQKESVWLVTYKKLVADKYVSVGEVLDELLCFGWIDGIRRKLDEDRTMQLISPRRVKHWTKTYKDRFLKLEQEGRMTEAGRQPARESQEAGLWNVLDEVDALQIPADIEEALRSDPIAKENFKAFSDSAKRFTLRWIKLAKSPGTRARRIKEFVALASRNQKISGL
jgi:uncharacterized protein YdeI (YjbR/CyaY-like superfamily)